MKRPKNLEQAPPSTKGRGSTAYQAREVKSERESCGEVQFWYCSECNQSKVVTSGSAHRDFETHMTLHLVKRMRFPGVFGPKLVWDRDKVGS